MGRTQIDLGSDEFELLDRAARVTGASPSELVRPAVRRTFGLGLAATALLLDADLLTTNVRHFPMLPDLAPPY